MADEVDLEQARAMPMDARAEHKNWKVRAEAFEEMRKQLERCFSSEDPVLTEYGKYTMYHTL